MLKFKRLLSTAAAVIITAAVSSTSIIGVGAAYSTYGSSTTAYSSKSGYDFYRFGVKTTQRSWTNIHHVSGVNRFVISQVLIFKPNAKGDFKIVENSVSNPVILKKGQECIAGIPQSASYRKYWHRGVLKEDTSYSSNAYHVFSYYKSF